MTRFIYTFVMIILSPFLLFGLYRSKPNKPKFGQRWKEHFGWTPPLLNQTSQPIWIHTVSVGETIAATPFIRALKQKYPDTPIVITTTTSTGTEQAQKLTDIAEHRYMPLDFPFAIKRFLKVIQPQQMIIMETELWPNTIHHVAKQSIPISVINARLSERSAHRYKKFQFIFNLFAKHLSLVLCQHQKDADRFIQLGIDENRVQVTGSLKFDISVSEDNLTKGKALREALGSQRPVWIAASTHQGEDEILLKAHQQLLEKHANALLILVPRHPERFNDVYKLCQIQGFTTERRTTQYADFTQAQVYLADTMGEMMMLLVASDVCFMGGSLLGDKVGGHNMLEPAVIGLPCITGPSYYNFSDIAEQLISAEAAFVCDGINIGHKVDQLFSSSMLRLESQKQALAIIDLNQGATIKTLSALD